MAYSFTAASSKYLSINAAIVSAAPLTVCAWFNTVAAVGAAAPQGIFNIASATTGNFMRIAVGTNAAISVNVMGNISVGPAYTSNTWAHAAGVFLSSTSRTAYLNGVAGTPNTASATPSALNYSVIGANAGALVGGYNNGRIAEVVAWNVALTADELTALSLGVPCTQIRPQSIAFYAPLIRDLVDLRGGLAITNNNGATVADHPRVYA